MNTNYKFLKIVENDQKFEYDVALQNDQLEIKDSEIIDKLDYTMATFSGLIAAAIDVFWVGQFSLFNAQKWGKEQAEKFVIHVAKVKGCKKNDIESSIKFLEKKYKIPSDSLASDFGGGLHHHLRDFAHHPTFVGLITSILTQFTGKCCGTDKDGNFIIIDVSSEKYIGDSFTEKIYNGIIIWFFHLISDMAGSSSNPGNGTGIPGPILGLMKELSALPIFSDKEIQYKNVKITIPVFISKLFNSTYYDGIRMDLRTELGITKEITRQSIPVIINKCLVKGMYFIKKLCYKLNEIKISSFTDFKLIDFKSIMPRKNKELNRMITVSLITFNTTEKTVAFVNATIKNKGFGGTFKRDFILSINIIGVGSLLIAIKNEIIYSIKERKIKEKEIIDNDYIDESSIVVDIDAVVNNDNIYYYTFYRLLNEAESMRRVKTERFPEQDKEFNAICCIGGENFDLYKNIVESIQWRFEWAHGELFRKLFTQNCIPYELIFNPDNYKYKNAVNFSPLHHMPFIFVINKNGKKIGYRISESFLGGDKKILQDAENDIKKYKIDFIRYITLYDPNDEGLKFFNDFRLKSDIVDCQLIRDFFYEFFSEDEYLKYYHYVKEYEEQVQIKVGFNTIVMSSDDMIKKSRIDKSDMLSKLNYEKMLPEEIYNNQKSILVNNYISKSRYKAITSLKDYAQSFISSEWHYDICNVTNSLDKTAVVSGYLKSIEQLLYKIICIYKNTGKTIKAKGTQEFIDFNNENEGNFDTTLGSLIGFLKHYPEIFDVNKYVRNHIIFTLEFWKTKYRNDHLHKDNIYSKEKVIKIREAAIYLYFLLLGGIKIEDDNYSQLGIYDQDKEKENDEVRYELTDERFANWLDPAINYGLSYNDNTVKFWLYPESYDSNGKWELQLSTTWEKYNDCDKEPEIKGYSLIEELIIHEDLSEEDIFKKVSNTLKNYINNSKYGGELKKYKVVALYHFSYKKEFFGEHKSIIFKSEK